MIVFITGRTDQGELVILQLGTTEGSLERLVSFSKFVEFEMDLFDEGITQLEFLTQMADLFLEGLCLVLFLMDHDLVRDPFGSVGILDRAQGLVLVAVGR